MYHSVTFGDKNTWDDWCLIPETEPIIVPPTQKTNFIDVPGADGALDMSEVLTGYPVYNNREGELTFLAMNRNAVSQPECNPYKYRDLVSIIMDHLQGKRMQMTLEDDPAYYYEGRFSLENVEASNDFNRITIKYKLDPYKWSKFSVIDSWIWDTFNFETDMITKGVLQNLTVDTTLRVVHLGKALLGTAPVCPTLKVSTSLRYGVYVRLVNPTLNINREIFFPDGTTQNSDCFFYGDNIDLYYRVLSGTGILTVDYRQGRL